MNQALKQYYTIGCCGIDCGLCPRYVSKSASACPGCGASGFYDKHPSCGFLTCCAKKHGLEVCSDCEEYPCSRFEAENEGYDSFVTHRKVLNNQEQIKLKGIDMFYTEQKQRMEILAYFIDHFDKGRSKSFFCQACTLLPTEHLSDIKLKAELLDGSMTLKERNSALTDMIQKISERLEIDLKLRKK